jgi:hypothetical protein
MKPILQITMPNNGSKMESKMESNRRFYDYIMDNTKLENEFHIIFIHAWVESIKLEILEMGNIKKSPRYRRKMALRKLASLKIPKEIK